LKNNLVIFIPNQMLKNNIETKIVYEDFSLNFFFP